MRLVTSIFLLLTVLATVVLAWQKEDHEIFDLVSAVENSEGKGTTFYSWLDVPATASAVDIARAYRKLSVKMHPDKNPNVKNAHERFARLGVVSSILRNPESRERYDFFYKNGVPKWRGTGYYYSRFRPGLGTVSLFLIIISSILQYVIQGINYKSDSKRVQHIIKEARLAAWGAKLVPVPGQRKVKVNLGVQRDEDGRPEGSKYIDVVVEGDSVYFLDTASGAMHLINDSIAVKPAFKNTWFIKLIGKYVVYRPTQRAEAKDSTERTSEDESSDSVGDVASEKLVKHQPATKTGGKRRKAARKH
ncbi:hypothetical protein AX14_004249 [Amanita brunnescens Koide BX004]|nr:hypothetical protein AX14_004249 [Amanita brunnescens Koide BX004]